VILVNFSQEPIFRQVADIYGNWNEVATCLDQVENHNHVARDSSIGLSHGKLFAEPALLAQSRLSLCRSSDNPNVRNLGADITGLESPSESTTFASNRSIDIGESLRLEYCCNRADASAP